MELSDEEYDAIIKTALFEIQIKDMLRKEEEKRAKRKYMAVSVIMAVLLLIAVYLTIKLWE